MQEFESTFINSLVKFMDFASELRNPRTRTLLNFFVENKPKEKSLHDLVKDIARYANDDTFDYIEICRLVKPLRESKILLYSRKGRSHFYYLNTELANLIIGFTKDVDSIVSLPPVEEEVAA